MTLRFALEPSSTDEILYTQAGRPTLDLRFASTKSLTDQVSGLPLIDFTRGGNGVGTYVGSDGLIKNSVVNLLLRSEEFDDASWSKSAGGVALSPVVTQNQATAPNGTNTADLIVFDLNGGTTSGDFSILNQNAATVAGLSYVFSVWARTSDGTSKSIQLTFNGALPDTGEAVQTVTGTWQRLVIGLNSASDAIRYPRIALRGGTGSSATASLYLWGAQLEQSSTVGEYVKTTSSISGASRFDHDPETGESLGLLVEEQRTNLVLQSQSLVTTPWLDSAATTSNAAIADVFGGTSASFKVTEDNSTATAHYVGQNFTAAVNTRYAVTAWYKVGSGDRDGRILLTNASAWNGSVAPRARIEFSTKSAQNVLGFETTEIKEYPNGWLRFTGVALSSATGGSFALRLMVSDGNESYDGNGTSYIYVGPCQLEAGFFPTSYMPTAGSSVIRNADIASITGTNFSRWYSQGQGTVFVDAKSNHIQSGINQFPRVASLSDGTTNNRIDSYFRVLTNYTDAGYSVTNAGVSQASFDTNRESNNTKLSTAFSLNNFAFAQAGVILNGATDSSGLVPAVNQLSIGRRSGIDLPLNGTIRRLVYFDRRLPNATLQSITSSTAPTTYGNLVLDSANTPQAIAGVAPTLDYRFARDRREIETVSLVDKLTYTGGNGTFVGSDGYIQQAATNAPRFDHDPVSRVSEGLLVEEQRTNLLEYSVDISKWSFIIGGSPTITLNAGTAPDGTNTATLIKNNGVTAYLGDATSHTSGTTYTFSGYFKANDGDQVAILLYSSGGSGGSSGFWNSETSNIATVFDLTNGTFTSPSGSVPPTTSSITDAGNGWWRCSITATCTTSNSFTNQLIRNFNGGTEGIYAWGYQIEAGAFPTSYTPTAGSTVTRTADSATIDGTGVLTGTYTIVEKPAGCAVESGGDIVLQEDYTVERVMVFPAALTAAQITAVREAM